MLATPQSIRTSLSRLSGKVCPSLSFDRLLWCIILLLSHGVVQLFVFNSRAHSDYHFERNPPLPPLFLAIPMLLNFPCISIPYSSNFWTPGVEVEITAADVQPGEAVILEPGSVIPAKGALIENLGSLEIAEPGPLPDTEIISYRSVEMNPTLKSGGYVLRGFGLMVVSSVDGAHDGTAKRRQSAFALDAPDDGALMQISQVGQEAIDSADPNLYRGSGRRPSVLDAEIARSDSGPSNPVNTLHNAKLTNVFSLMSLAKKWKRYVCSAQRVSRLRATVLFGSLSPTTSTR